MLSGKKGTHSLALFGPGEIRLAAGELLSIDLRGGGRWYGHGFSHRQPYPLETGEAANPAFAVNNIQCPAWMCSAGYLLFAETVAPLDVRINEGGSGRLEIRCPGEPLVLREFRRGRVHRPTARIGRPPQSFSVRYPS